jgi:hypothetical protein
MERRGLTIRDLKYFRDAALAKKLVTLVEKAETIQRAKRAPHA